MRLRKPPISNPIPNPPFGRSEKEGASPLAPLQPPASRVQEVAAPLGVQQEEKAPQLKLVRAKDEEGKFVPDDPSTPDVNEAWVSGVEP